MVLQRQYEVDLAKTLLARVAESQARQEYFIDSVSHAAHLAIEQVQDKRIENLETGPEITLGGAFVDMMLSYVLGPFAATALRVGARGTLKQLTNVIVSRRLARTIEQTEFFEMHNLRRVSRAPLNTTIPLTSTKHPDYAVYAKLGSDLAGVGLDYEKRRARSQASASGKSKKPREEKGDDSAGVGILKSVFRWARQQALATRESHASLQRTVYLDLHLTGGETLNTLKSVIEPQLTANLEPDVFTKQNDQYIEELSLLFEAAIWVRTMKVFGVRYHSEDQYRMQTMALNKPVGEEVWVANSRMTGYWIDRFRQLWDQPQFAGKTPKDRLALLWKKIDSETSDLEVFVTRVATPKKP